MLEVQPKRCSEISLDNKLHRSDKIVSESCVLMAEKPRSIVSSSSVLKVDKPENIVP